jgi:TolB protein
LKRLATRTALTSLLVLMVGIGCSSSPSGLSRESTSSSVPQNEHLRTNLYGDLENWRSVPFSSKPAASLMQHSFSEEGGDADPIISPDGKWIFFSSLRHSPNPDLYIKPMYGAVVTRLTSDPASEMQPSVSPLGDTVAYASNRGSSWNIWIIGIDGTNPVRLTSSGSNDIHPSWSPDGKQIVYSSFGSRSQQWELWVVDAITPSIKKMIGYGLNPVWCPNPQQSKIAYQLSRYRGSRWFSVWTIDYVGGDAKFPTEIISSVEYACICPAWSLDGSKLAYSTVSRRHYEQTADSGVPDISGEAIFIIDIDGRNNLRLTNEDATNFSPTWSPEGRIFYCSDRKGIDNIWSIKPYQLELNREKPIDLSQHPLSGFQAN